MVVFTFSSCDSLLELSFCKKPQKRPNQETGLGNRERLKVLILNDTKLILNHYGDHSCSFRTNQVSFRTFRRPLLPKPVSWMGVGFFAISYSKTALVEPKQLNPSNNQVVNFPYICLKYNHLYSYGKKLLVDFVQPLTQDVWQCLGTLQTLVLKSLAVHVVLVKGRKKSSRVSVQLEERRVGGLSSITWTEFCHF